METLTVKIQYAVQAIHCARSKVLTSIMPLLTADMETSMRKKYTGGMGGRTIYSAGATNSTVPFVSSGR